MQESKIEMNIHPMFATPVAMCQIGRDLTGEETEFLKNVEMHCVEHEGKPFYTDWGPSDTDLFSRPEMESIAKFCKSALLAYYDSVFPNARPRTSLAITQSWVNRKGLDCVHTPHFHSNSFISAVFSVWGRDPIILIPDRKAGFFDYLELSWEKSDFIATRHAVEIPRGGFLIFPSSLMHSVESIRDPEGRCTISMNTFPVGNLGSTYCLNSLKIDGAGIGSDDGYKQEGGQHEHRG